MLVLGAFLAPLAEFFDQWDPPGPSNDTEMAVFCLILAFCLVLLVCKLLALQANRVTFEACARRNQVPIPTPALPCSFVGLVLPQISPPLRI